MTVRKSHAFAALRQQVITELNEDIKNTLIPQFNAAIEDIRREYEALVGEAPALADHKKRARILDLTLNKQKFLDECNTRLKMECTTRVEEYGGTVEEVEEGGKKILQASFPDGSKARMPRSLWIDHTQFQRV